MNKLDKRRAKIVEQFLKTCGQPQISHELKWEDKQSFFDKDVQAVLLTALPDDIDHAAAEELAMPVMGWTVADAFCRFPTEGSLAAADAQAWQCGPHAQWFNALQAAVSAYYSSQKQGTVAEIRKWRTDWYLDESSRLALPRAEAKHINAKIVKSRQFIGPMPEWMGCAPVAVSSEQQPPKKYMEPKDPQGPPTPQAAQWSTITAEAARKAMHDENRRREKTMRKWAPCWLALFGKWPMKLDPETTSEPEKVKRKAVTKTTRKR